MFRIEFIMYIVNNQDFIRLTTITWKEDYMKKIYFQSISLFMSLGAEESSSSTSFLSQSFNLAPITKSSRRTLHILSSFKKPISL